MKQSRRSRDAAVRASMQPRDKMGRFQPYNTPKMQNAPTVIMRDERGRVSAQAQRIYNMVKKSGGTVEVTPLNISILPQSRNEHVRSSPMDVIHTNTRLREMIPGLITDDLPIVEDPIEPGDEIEPDEEDQIDESDDNTNEGSDNVPAKPLEIDSELSALLNETGHVTIEETAPTGPETASDGGDVQDGDILIFRVPPSVPEDGHDYTTDPFDPIQPDAEIPKPATDDSDVDINSLFGNINRGTAKKGWFRTSMGLRAGDE